MIYKKVKIYAQYIQYVDFYLGAFLKIVRRAMDSHSFGTQCK
jgi:hypothetical protein